MRTWSPNTENRPNKPWRLAVFPPVSALAQYQHSPDLHILILIIVLEQGGTHDGNHRQMPKDFESDASRGVPEDPQENTQTDSDC